MLQSAQIWRQICGALKQRGGGGVVGQTSRLYCEHHSPPSHLGRTALHPSFSGLELLASRMQDLKLVWLCGWRNDHQSHLLIHRSEEAFKTLLSLRLLPAILVYEILQSHRLLSFYRSRVFVVFGCWTQDQDNNNTSNKDKNNDNPGDL